MMSKQTNFPVIQEPVRDIPIRAETDVLVVGGGAAGVAAAVSAARGGADVMLVERYGYLGGLATGGLIILLLTLDDGLGRQVVGGLCQEVVDRLSSRGAAHFPPARQWGDENLDLIKDARHWGLVWGAGPHRVRYSVAYEPEELKFILNSMLEETGVQLLLHAWASEPLLDNGSVRGVTFQSKAGRFAVLAKVVIDASGDGDIVAAAGCSYEKEEVLPWLWFCMGGVQDIDAAVEQGGWFFRSIGEGKVLLPWGATEKISRRIDATDPADLTYAEIEGRKRVMEEVDRLKREVPGFKNAHLCHVADQLGVTESRRLSGEYVLTRDDLDKKFSDVIAVTGHWTKYGVLYHIPYRSLLPKELDNVLVAGRCISVDHRVHHATKEIPPCMATGEAAGMAAALSLTDGVNIKQLSVQKLQDRLSESGAILWP